MSKLQPAPLAFPNGGALKAVANKKRYIKSLKQRQIDLETKLAVQKAATPEEKERIMLRGKIASTKVGKN